MGKLKQLFCKHDWDIVTKVSKFHCLSGEQLYKRCKKCEKVIPYIYIKHDDT